MIRRSIVCIVALATALMAANIRLYLKDGNYQVVREYKVVDDRVRYYSVERSAWEEIPLELIDLQKTEGEIKSRDESRNVAAAKIAAEEKFDRQQQRELERIPQNPGVYLVEGEQLRTINAAESKVVNNKRRSILKALSPIPIISGKATVELDGPTSLNIVAASRPELY